MPIITLPNPPEKNITLDQLKSGVKGATLGMVSGALAGGFFGAGAGTIAGFPLGYNDMWMGMRMMGVGNALLGGSIGLLIGATVCLTKAGYLKESKAESYDIVYDTLLGAFLFLAVPVAGGALGYPFFKDNLENSHSIALMIASAILGVSSMYPVCFSLLEFTPYSMHG